MELCTIPGLTTSLDQHQTCKPLDVQRPPVQQLLCLLRTQQQLSGPEKNCLASVYLTRSLGDCKYRVGWWGKEVVPSQNCPPIYSNVHKSRLHQSALSPSGPDSGTYGAVLLETQPRGCPGLHHKVWLPTLGNGSATASQKHQSIRQRETQEGCACLSLVGRFFQR